MWQWMMSCSQKMFSEDAGPWVWSRGNKGGRRCGALDTGTHLKWDLQTLMYKDMSPGGLHVKVLRDEGRMRWYISAARLACSHTPYMKHTYSFVCAMFHILFSFSFITYPLPYLTYSVVPS